MRFGVDIYMPRINYDLLDKYFENLEVKPADDHICNFKEQFEAFW